ncbi:hypothetical protein L6R49_27800 [Myxococcota bacterium]|nr:hypothetical protein [Myxococcota bacterium]
MRVFTVLSFALISLNGCIIYEDTYCRGEGCEPFDDDSDWDVDDDDDSAEDDTAEDDDGASGDPDIPDLTLGFFPSQAEQGETFLASITVTEGQQNLTAVSELRLYGPAELITWGARPGEITAAISVADDAELGEVDVVVVLDDGRAELLPAALTIFAAGSGNTADEWAESARDCE